MKEGHAIGDSNDILPILETATEAEIHRNCCRFVVTGFGPFCNIPVNPTSVLIHRLRAEDGLQRSTKDNNFDRNAIPNTKNISATATILQETHILETSVEYVREWFIYLPARLMPSTTSVTTTTREIGTKTVATEDEGKESNSDYSKGENADNTLSTHVNTSTIKDGDNQTLFPTTTVLLHLGVDSNSTQFKLEQCAYNDATFRVPDERGYQPHCECIISVDNNEISCSGMEEASSPTDSHRRSWGECLRTTIDLQSVCEELEQCTNENVTISTDPGRFVCNYTYYLSLDLCHSMNSKSSNCNDNEIMLEREENNACASHHHRVNYHALFLHVPPFEVISEERQINFLHQVMKTISARTSMREEK